MSSRERNMLIGLGVVAVAALAFFLLTSGDGESQEATAPTSISSSPGSATAPLPVEEVGQEKEQEDPAAALDPLGGRDPFVPLVEDAASGGETSTEDTTTGGTTTADDTTAGETTTGGESATGDTTTGETTPGETTTGGSSSGGGGSSSAEEVDVSFTGRPVSLVSISSGENGNVARIKVGRERIMVREGYRFSRFEVLSVGSHCARLQLGDRSFTLCE